MPQQHPGRLQILVAQGQQLPPSASTGLAVVNTTKTKDLVKTGGGRVLFS